MLDELSQYGTRLPQMISVWRNEATYNRIRKYEPEDYLGFAVLFPEEKEILIETEKEF